MGLYLCNETMDITSLPCILSNSFSRVLSILTVFKPYVKTGLISVDYTYDAVSGSVTVLHNPADHKMPFYTMRYARKHGHEVYDMTWLLLNILSYPLRVVKHLQVASWTLFKLTITKIHSVFEGLKDKP